MTRPCASSRPRTSSSRSRPPESRAHEIPPRRPRRRPGVRPRRLLGRRVAVAEQPVHDAGGLAIDARARDAAAAVDLTIYGAASLKGALEKAKTAYEAAVPGTTLTISTDASSALATKIEQGAPADVFLSADTKNPQELVDKGLTDGPAVDFAGNKLTVIVPADNPAGITTPADLAKAGVKIIAAGDEVPITKYATQLVDNLAKEPGYPADFAAAYAANIVSKEDNVKAVVAKIELGEGDAGIVYVTDAAASTKVVDRRRARLGERPRDLRRRRRQGVPERRRRPGVPGLVRRARRPGDPGRLRVPAAAVVIEAAAGHPGERRLRSAVRGRHRRWQGAGASARSRRSPRSSPSSWDCRSSRWSCGRSSMGRSRSRSGSPVVLDALWLSLVTTAISLVITVTFGLPLAFVLARRRFRGKGLVEAIVDLPIVLPPAVAGLALLLVFGRRGLLSAPFDAPRHLGAVHDDRRDPRPDVRLRPVLHPLGADRDRRRRPRPRGRGARGRRLGAAAVQRRSRSRSRERPSRPA